MFSLGFDIGGTTVKAGLVDGEYRVVEKLSAPTPYGSAEKLADTVKTLAERLSAGVETAHIGVTVPGTFDKEGNVKRLCNIGLNDFPLVGMLRERLGRTAALYNDADAAALAELKTGSLRGAETGVLVTIGTGIGCGIIMNGRLFTGGLGRGTELGHTVLDRGGKLCSCGNRGCAETVCSATALNALAQAACNRREGMIYFRYAQGAAPDAKLLIDCAMAGDEYAINAFEGYTDAFSDLLASIVNFIDPQIIAIGGGVSGAGEFLLEPLRKKTAAKAFFGSCGSIVAAACGNDAGMIGAAIPVGIE